jgi:hypothetical protein
MKQTLLLLLVAFTLNNINAQEIEATTAGGKKVMLNLDNYSWRYSNSQDGQKSCYTFHTGNVNFVNKTTQDVYLYYSESGVSQQIKYIKIQKGDNETVESLTTKRISPYDGNTTQTIQYKYGWVASYELYSNLNQYYVADKLEKIKGFASGEFTLEDCDTKAIKIQD